MPFVCTIGGYSHKSWIHKTLKFHSFPKDESLKRKWIRVVSVRRKDYKWKSTDRVCSAHFPGGHKYGAKNIPSIFPRRDMKSGAIVWPVDISYLLHKESSPVMAEQQLTDAVSNGPSTDNSGTVSVNTGSPESKSSDDGIALVQQSLDANKKKLCGMWSGN